MRCFFAFVIAAAAAAVVVVVVVIVIVAMVVEKVVLKVVVKRAVKSGGEDGFHFMAEYALIDANATLSRKVTNTVATVATSLRFTACPALPLSA